MEPQAETYAHAGIDYSGMSSEWLADFLAWREERGPEDHTKVAREYQPRRLRLSNPHSAIENLMVRSTNAIDGEQIDGLASRKGSTKDLIRAGRAFYKRGNYIAHREELFGTLDRQGADTSISELYVRLAEVINIIPESSLRQQGFSKLCRTVGGFAFMSLLVNSDGGRGLGGISDALRAGYDFGVTYPLVDDLLHDSDYLERATGNKPHDDLNTVVEHWLSTGSTEGVDVPENSITTELKHAFQDATEIFPFEDNRELYRAVLMLHYAQIADAAKSEFIHPPTYEKEDFTPYIVKAALTRIIPFMVAKGGPANVRVADLRRIIGLGLRTQLHDDLIDLESDAQHGVHTPFSPYLAGNVRDGVNPSELLIDSLFYSVDQDFVGDHRQRAAQVLLGTAIHAFGGLDDAVRERLGLSPDYVTLIDNIGKRYTSAKVEGKLQEQLDSVALKRSRLYKKIDVYLFDVQDRVNGLLKTFVEDANEQFKPMYQYAILAQAKRMRPAFAYITADTFGAEREHVDDFALAAELLHTASLIFDDLPGQDDADRRRGKKTIHKEFGEGEAQLAALAMIFDAQTLVAQLDATHGLDGCLVAYVNESLGQRGLCFGQLEDLQTFNAGASSEETLDSIASLKTGLAIEMSVVGAAMIAHQPGTTIQSLQDYAYHAGIAFQVKDDLLDSPEAGADTGKNPGMDERNGKLNYARLLGADAAQAKMTFHISAARTALAQLPESCETRKYLEVLDRIATRDS